MSPLAQTLNSYWLMFFTVYGPYGRLDMALFLQKYNKWRKKNYIIMGI